MENLAEKITIFLAAHNYIAEDKKDWCHYVVIKFLMSVLSLCLLIPIGSLIVGWIGSILYTFTFRFLRARTGGISRKDTSWMSDYIRYPSNTVSFLIHLYARCKFVYICCNYIRTFYCLNRSGKPPRIASFLC